MCLVAAGRPVDEIFDFVPVQHLDGLRAAATGAHEHANLVTRRDRMGTQKNVPASEQQVGPHDLLWFTACLGRRAPCCCYVVALHGLASLARSLLPHVSASGARQPIFCALPRLTLTLNCLLQARYVCWATGQDCTRLRFHCLLRPDIDLSPQAFADGKLPPGLLAQHFVRLDQAEIQVRHTSMRAAAAHQGWLGLLSTQS